MTQDDTKESGVDFCSLVKAGFDTLFRDGPGLYGPIEVADWDGSPLIVAAGTPGYVTLVRVEFEGKATELCFEQKEFAAIRRAMDSVDRENPSS